MISRLKKLPVSVIITVILLLLCVGYVELVHSEFRSRVTHHCLNPRQGIYDCYSMYYGNLAKNKGTKKSLAELNVNKVGDMSLSANCHQSMHAIGRNAFQEYGSIAQAYVHADYSCWGGYMHGVVEASMSRKKMSDFSAEDLRTMCDEVKGSIETSFSHFSCIHGIGHALMYISHNDLPNALVRCEDLVDGWEIRQCVNGSFMENTLADEDHPSKFSPKNDPHFPCSAVPEKYADVCYQVQSKYILDYLGNFKEAFEFCKNLPHTKEQNLCAQGLGAAVSVYNKYNILTIAQICNAAPVPLDNECLYGALTNLEGMSRSVKLGNEVCQNLPQEKGGACLRTLDKAHADFPAADKSSTSWNENI